MYSRLRTETETAMARKRTKKAVLAMLNPKNLGHYHFKGAKKATLASIYRNQKKRPRVKKV